jgi:FdhE protein
MRDSWDDRIQRAETLAARTRAADAMLGFYVCLLRIQKDIYEWLRNRPLTGELAADTTGETQFAPKLLAMTVSNGPTTLRERAERLPSSVDFEEIAQPFWHSPSDRDFFGKALVQPYLERLAELRVPPRHRDHLRGERRCPFCGGAPQLSILEEHAASLESGGRQLQCANCLNCWTYRRIVCVHCGEEDEHKLGYYQADEFPHVRIDSCETCRHYLKSIDLGKLGLAVPIVDEMAGVALDAWAADQGLTKIELNLAGM